MAVQISDYNHNGLVAPAAYARIESIRGSKVEGWAFLAKIYASESMANPAKIEVRPAIDEVKDKDGKVVRVAEAAILADAPKLFLTEIGFSLPYVSGKIPYELGYVELMKKFPGSQSV